jgi:hypothetical protein
MNSQPSLESLATVPLTSTEEGNSGRLLAVILEELCTLLYNHFLKSAHLKSTAC